MKMAGAVPVVLMAAYPVLFLYSHNANQTAIYVLWIPLAAAIGTALLAWGIVFVLLKDHHLSTLLVTLGLVLFYSYGHVHNALLDAHLEIGRNRYLLSIWALLFIVGSYASTRMTNRRAAAVQVLSVISIALVAQSLYGIGRNVVLRRSASGLLSAPAPEGVDAIRLVPPESLPDIYYIILDGYMRSDTLADATGFDNGGFEQELKDRGFYIASESRSNYMYTFLSLAATLNMGYVNYIADILGPQSENISAPLELIRSHTVGRLLKSAGYTYVQIGSWWTGTQTSSIADEMITLEGIYEKDRFDSLLFEQTMLFPITGVVFPRPWYEADERASFIYQFEQLATTRRESQPTFVFMHVIAPHQPYVWRADGSPVDEPESGWTQEESISAYVEQLQFVNQNVIEAIDLILSRSTVPPIIVIQSDHGWAFEDPWSRYSHIQEMPDSYLDQLFGNLNAFYLPGDSEIIPYRSISSVNTFRLLFNRYFDTRLELLSDKSYYSDPIAGYYDFTEVTSRLKR